jgi:hypothetical protein
MHMVAVWVAWAECTNSDHSDLLTTLFVIYKADIQEEVFGRNSKGLFRHTTLKSF